MARDDTTLSYRLAAMLWAVSTVVITTGWAAVTSPQVKNAVTTAVTATGRGTAAVVLGICRFVGRRYPTARNIVVRGIIGGFRYFRSQFNRNRSQMVRNTRNRVSPFEWVALAISIIVLLLNPVIGVALLLMTVVVFFQDADQLPLSSFSLDSIGVGSIVGVATAVVVHLFILVGAVTATISWVRSQL